MTRSRPVPPSTSAEAAEASLPEGLPPLSVLLEAARAPGASRAEVDALLEGLSQPLPEDQSPREHADLLLSIIKDKRLGDFTGSNGLTVRYVAAHAVVDLGLPYAREVSTEALTPKEEVKPKAQDEAVIPSIFSTGRGKAGLVALGFLVIVELVMMIQAVIDASKSTGQYLPLDHPHYYENPEFPWGEVLVWIACTTVLPAVLMELGHHLRARFIRIVGKAGLILVGVLCLALGLLSLMLPVGNFEPFPVVIGSLSIASALLMDAKKP